MFLKRIELFSILGFRVSLDLSWFLLAILIVWTLSKGYFPSALPGEETSTYVWMAIVGALGLFLSIILHEFAHAIVARRYNLAISGITLFVFGGVAEMTEEPERPMAEFMMAIAGPIMSFAIAAVCYFAATNVLAGAGSARDHDDCQLSGPDQLDTRNLQPAPCLSAGWRARCCARSFGAGSANLSAGNQDCFARSAPFSAP